MFAGAHSINVGRVRVVEFIKMPEEAIRVLIKAVRVPISIVGEPKEAIDWQNLFLGIDSWALKV